MDTRFNLKEEEKNRILDLHKIRLSEIEELDNSDGASRVVNEQDVQYGATTTIRNQAGSYISPTAWAPNGVLTGKNVPEITGKEPEVVDITQPRTLQSTMSDNSLEVPSNGTDPNPHDDVTWHLQNKKRGEIDKPLEKTPCCKKCNNGKFKRCGRKDKECKYVTISDCQLKGKKGNMEPLRVEGKSKALKEDVTRIKKLYGFRNL
jgi:hypothetical protein